MTKSGACSTNIGRISSVPGRHPLIFGNICQIMAKTEFRSIWERVRPEFERNSSMGQRPSAGQVWNAFDPSRPIVGNCGRTCPTRKVVPAWCLAGGLRLTPSRGAEARVRPGGNTHCVRQETRVVYRGPAQTDTAHSMTWCVPRTCAGIVPGTGEEQHSVLPELPHPPRAASTQPGKPRPIHQCIWLPITWRLPHQKRTPTHQERLI